MSRATPTSVIAAARRRRAEARRSTARPFAAPEKRSRSFRDFLLDNSAEMGALGLVGGSVLVGATYYIVSAGDAAIYRQQLLDAADVSSFSAAVIDARGYNVVSLINVLLGAIAAVLSVLQTIASLLNTGFLIAMYGFCAPGCHGHDNWGCWACPYAATFAAGESYVSGVHSAAAQVVAPVETAIEQVSNGIRIDLAFAALSKAQNIATNLISADGCYTAPADEDLPFAALGIAAGMLCDAVMAEAQSFYGPWLQAAGGAGLGQFFSVGRSATSFISSYSSSYCPSYQSMDEDVFMGDEELQKRGVCAANQERTESVLKNIKFATAAAREGVDRRIASKHTSLVDKMRFVVTQAESYCDDANYNSDEFEREEWLWHMCWTSRFRKTRFLQNSELMTRDCYLTLGPTACEGIAGIEDAFIGYAGAALDYGGAGGFGDFLSGLVGSIASDFVGTYLDGVVGTYLDGLGDGLLGDAVRGVADGAVDGIAGGVGTAVRTGDVGAIGQGAVTGAVGAGTSFVGDQVSAGVGIIGDQVAGAAGDAVRGAVGDAVTSAIGDGADAIVQRAADEVVDVVGDEVERRIDDGVRGVGDRVRGEVTSTVTSALDGDDE